MVSKIAQANYQSQLDSQNHVALKQVWHTIEANSCPTLYNFHMHTINSDGQLLPEELAQQAVNLGLKGFAITDHHSVSGYYAAQAWLEARDRETHPNSLPNLWTGVEITSSLLDTDVHILGYTFDPQHPVMQIYLQGESPWGEDAEAVNVINAIHQAGGLAVLAHPARYKRSLEELIPAAAKFGIDGVEAYYSYRNTFPWQSSPIETQKVKDLSEKYDLFNTCGTDTHGLDIRKRI